MSKKKERGPRSIEATRAVLKTAIISFLFVSSFLEALQGSERIVRQ